MYILIKSIQSELDQGKACFFKFSLNPANTGKWRCQRDSFLFYFLLNFANNLSFQVVKNRSYELPLDTSNLQNRDQ